VAEFKDGFRAWGIGRAAATGGEPDFASSFRL
jgi:hypothetical protein